MKTSENKEKKRLRELSEEELKEVTGGSSFDCSLPENKDKFQCSDKLRGLDGNWGEILDVDLARVEKWMPQL